MSQLLNALFLTKTPDGQAPSSCLVDVFIYKNYCLENRSAFALFESKGVTAVKDRFPKSVKFVLENSQKTLDHVTPELTEKLTTYSENVILA